MSQVVFDAPARARLDLSSITLAAGGHTSVDDGMCVMEAVSVAAGECWSDEPYCASRVITTFLRSWNDVLRSADRQALKRHVFAAIGTRTGRRDDGIRAWMVCDWLVREQASAWLHLAGLSTNASELAALGEVTAKSSLSSQPSFVRARAAVEAALGGLLVGQLDYGVANAAAWDSGYEAAWDTLGVASERDGEFLCNEDWDAALSLTLSALRLASDRDLHITVTALQASAHRLVERMCGVGR